METTATDLAHLFNKVFDIIQTERKNLEAETVAAYTLELIRLAAKKSNDDAERAAWALSAQE